MPFRWRPDGDYVGDVPPTRRIMPFLMRGRNESVAYFEQKIDTTKTWLGDPVHVSQGPGSEFVEIMQYSISYLGERRLMESGSALETYQDVIRIKGQANQGQGEIEAYLAPDAGIIYYYYITAFGHIFRHDGHPSSHSQALIWCMVLSRRSRMISNPCCASPTPPG